MNKVVCKLKERGMNCVIEALDAAYMNVMGLFFCKSMEALTWLFVQLSKDVCLGSIFKPLIRNCQCYCIETLQKSYFSPFSSIAPFDFCLGQSRGCLLVTYVEGETNMVLSLQRLT